MFLTGKGHQSRVRVLGKNIEAALAGNAKVVGMFNWLRLCPERLAKERSGLRRVGTVRSALAKIEDEVVRLDIGLHLLGRTYHEACRRGAGGKRIG